MRAKFPSDPQSGLPIPSSFQVLDETRRPYYDREARNKVVFANTIDTHYIHDDSPHYTFSPSQSTGVTVLSNINTDVVRALYL